MPLDRERQELIKQRDAALQEAELWRFELEKTREHANALEAQQMESDNIKDQHEFIVGEGKAAYGSGIAAVGQDACDSDHERRVKFASLKDLSMNEH